MRAIVSQLVHSQPCHRFGCLGVWWRSRWLIPAGRYVCVCDEMRWGRSQSWQSQSQLQFAVCSRSCGQLCEGNGGEGEAGGFDPTGRYLPSRHSIPPGGCRWVGTISNQTQQTYEQAIIAGDIIRLCRRILLDICRVGKVHRGRDWRFPGS